MSTKTTDHIMSSVKNVLKLNNLEEAFLDPQQFKDLVDPKPTVISQPTVSATPVPAPKEVAARKGPTTAFDILEPFIGVRIVYKSRKASFYPPSCLMMDYIVHNINNLLVDHHYFKRDSPNYHPYILRLYYGVVFWIQCLRAGLEARSLTFVQHQFLVTFIDNFPLESLPIAGPLLPLFKTLCVSVPEFTSYGTVSPSLPARPGPATREAFMKADVSSYFLPNIPGIFALLEHLNSLMNPAATAGTQAVYPKKGKHFPVPKGATTATIFGHHSFPALATRTIADKYALCSPGLQYACEADQKLNESFSERFDSFGFPTLAAEDVLEDYPAFMHMATDLSWFDQVKDVAATAAQYFQGSETLADCSPRGITANQVIVAYRPPTTPAAPEYSCDPKARFPFAYRLSSTARSLAPLTEAMAAMAQTHIRMFGNHPHLSTFGATPGTGPFWDIRPIEFSGFDDSSYLALPGRIKDMLKSKDSKS